MNWCWDLSHRQDISHCFSPTRLFPARGIWHYSLSHGQPWFGFKGKLNVDKSSLGKQGLVKTPLENMSVPKTWGRPRDGWGDDTIQIYSEVCVWMIVFIWDRGFMTEICVGKPEKFNNWYLVQWRVSGDDVQSVVYILMEFDPIHSWSWFCKYALGFEACATLAHCHNWAHDTACNSMRIHIFPLTMLYIDGVDEWEAFS